MVSCIQLLEETKTEKEDGDVTAEYINEIVDLKLQLANHWAKIDELEASLNRYMLGNETLLAEKSALVDELVQYQCRQSLDESSRSDLEGVSCSVSSFRSSILSMGRRRRIGGRKNGSIEMLLESNSHLLLQNSQLQVENYALRKALQANILGNRQRRRDVQPQSGHKASFVTTTTADETSLVSSPMPAHWPALNDPY